MSSGNRVAYIFPGQGSQAAGMGKDIYTNYASARAVFDEADRALGFPLSALCFEGPEDELTKTVNVQPAILTVSIAYLRAARELSGTSLPSPDFVAGHSLGQYSALVAAGVLSLGEAVRLVRERGRLMYEAGQATPGGMLAVIGSDEETVRKVCAATGAQISNINSPGQIVVSGKVSVLDEFKKLAPQHGIRRAIPLKVSGAFHSDLMKPAVEGLKKAISGCNFRQADVPVVSNVTAEIITSAEAIKKELVDQITNCVQWQRSIENMIDRGVNAFYEIGYGQVVGGLVKRINSEVKIVHIAELLNPHS